MRRSGSFGSHIFGKEQVRELMPRELAEDGLARIDRFEPPGRAYVQAWIKILKTWTKTKGAERWTFWPFGKKEFEPIDSLDGDRLLEHPSYSLDFFFPPFLLQIGQKHILCIPVFFNPKGQKEIDDHNALLLAMQKIKEACLRLGKVAKSPSDPIRFEIEIKQEWMLFSERKQENVPLFARTVYQAEVPVESSDKRANAFWSGIEQSFVNLGIKTVISVEQIQSSFSIFSQNPAKGARIHELAIEVLKEKAAENGLSCLFYEGTHARKGRCGLQCQAKFLSHGSRGAFASTGHSVADLCLFAASLRAVQLHGSLVQQDFSVFGDNPSELIERLLVDQTIPDELKKIEFFIERLGDLPWVLAAFCAAVADSLHLILDEIEDAQSRSPNLSQKAAIWPVLERYFSYCLSIAKLPAQTRGFHGFSAIGEAKTARVFQGIISEDALRRKMEQKIDAYVQETELACRTMIELFHAQIVPSADGKNVELKEMVKVDRKALQQAIEAIRDLESMYHRTQDLGLEAKGRAFCDLIAPRMDAARQAVDKL